MTSRVKMNGGGGGRVVREGGGAERRLGRQTEGEKVERRRKQCQF